MPPKSKGKIQLVASNGEPGRPRGHRNLSGRLAGPGSSTPLPAFKSVEQWVNRFVVSTNWRLHLHGTPANNIISGRVVEVAGPMAPLEPPRLFLSEKFMSRTQNENQGSAEEGASSPDSEETRGKTQSIFDFMSDESQKKPVSLPETPWPLGNKRDR